MLIPGSTLLTWGILHNHWGHSPRWLCNISKVSISSVKPGTHAIIDLDYDSDCGSDYGWFSILFERTSVLLIQLGTICFCKHCSTWILSNDWFILWLVRAFSNRNCIAIEIFCAMHGLISFSQWNVAYITSGLLIKLVTLLEYLSCSKT